MRILLTGGTGFIGSHVAVSLIDAGYEVVCFDNLSNSTPCVADRISAVTGKKVPLVVGDIRNKDLLCDTLTQFGIEAVIHLAGLKAVGESVANPIAYYDTNVLGTMTLLEAMAECGIKVLAFSSSATVYGEPRYLPIDEAHPTCATNPYGRTKLMVEDILRDLSEADPQWRIAVLRYFNPVGAHETGLLGEDPKGTPNNLMPYISRVAAGRLEGLSVFGADYDTPDGSGIRDYIHVVDLAEGHVAALDAVRDGKRPYAVWNLGTGQGYSVFEIIRAFERANGISIPYTVEARRSGDVVACYASAVRAQEELHWKARRGIDQMCSSAWRYERGKEAA